MVSIFSDPTVDHAIWIYLTALVAALVAAFLVSPGDSLPSLKIILGALLGSAVPALAAYGAAQGWATSNAGSPATVAGPPATPPTH